MENGANSKSKPFEQQVEAKEKVKMDALEGNKQSVWAGLGVFGMVGWSVVVPALVGTLLGNWLDNKYQQSFSWTLTMLLSGLAMGCFIAWSWVDKEDKNMHKK